MTLYRKWRPRTFADLVGQRHVAVTLQNTLAADRIGHAYLFIGPRGTGKTTIARLLAKAVNCVGDGEKPCGVCRICKAVDEARFMDLIEIDAASNNGVDQIRELRDRVALAPSDGRYKVYIIDETHMLTTAAFNALLKTLEEPPGHVIFVLATTEPEKIPDTISSRCQRFEFQRITKADITGRLRVVSDAEGIQAEDEALALIAKRATGSMRDALSLLEQMSGFSANQVTAELVRQMLDILPLDAMSGIVDALIARNLGEALDEINRLVERGARPHSLAEQLVEYVRLLLLAASGQINEQEIGDSAAKLKAQAERIEVGELVRWLERLTEAARMKGVGGTLAQLPLELAAAQIVTGPPKQIAAAAPPVSPSKPNPAPKPAPAPKPKPDKTPPVVVGATLPEDKRSLDGLREAWKDAVLSPLRALDRQTEALLNSCQPVDLTDDKLTVTARYEFHLRKLSDKTRRARVEAVVSNALGRPAAVVFALEREWQVKAQTEDWPPETAAAVISNPLVQEAVALGGVVKPPEDF